jgi:hypothetical protein
MIDPETVREVAIDLAAFKREVDPQFRLLTRLFYWIIFILLGMAGGGFAIYAQIGDLKATAAATARDVAAVNERMAKVEKSISDMATSQGQVVPILNQILTRLATAPAEQGPFRPLSLTPYEEQIIREFLNLPKGPTKGPPRYAIGDPVPDQEVNPIPEPLAGKLPKLRGAKFAYDPSGWALIVGAGNRVVAIISLGD